MPSDPFLHFVAALNDVPDSADQSVRFDPERCRRTGIPEIIYGAGKSQSDLISAIDASVTQTGRAIVSQSPSIVASYIIQSYRVHHRVVYHNDIPVIVIHDETFTPEARSGRIGIIAAGTSDGPQAGAVRVISEEMGCDTATVMDVGVAGLHRLVAPLRGLMAWNPDVLVAVAGMDGALPSVLAGLVDVPVIGLPTSTGYGMGGDGTAALLSMLQSCAPGLVVVNIDNAVGAATSAALIAKRAAAGRQSNTGDNT